MGCVASKLEEEDEVVSICRERKRKMKLAVEKRYELAEAHCRYCQSLYVVAGAINLFVACHSSPSSPYLITLPPATGTQPVTEPSLITSSNNNPMFLQQNPTESKTHEAIAGESFVNDVDGSSMSSDSSEEENLANQQLRREEGNGYHGHNNVHNNGYNNGYFYMQQEVIPPPMPSPQGDFGWDFFNPFDGMRPEVISGYRRSSDDDLRVVREEEGIPELEEDVEEETKEEEKKVVVVDRAEKGREFKESDFAEMVKLVESNCNGSLVEQKGPSPQEGRELLEALKDIEDYFHRACDSGKDVSRMLEANKVNLLSGLGEIKENSTKLIQAIAWRRSNSSCKSLVASSSKSSSSTWTEFKNELFDDDYQGMDSGSHSLTLGRIYAWEKKLYEQVKTGDNMRKIYEKKCSRLGNQDVKGEDEVSMDRTRAEVKDLYARILVAIRSAESISKRIQKLRDEELRPQIVELLKGLTSSWKIMKESHETQYKILCEVKSFTRPVYGKFCNDSHRRATLKLWDVIHNWRSCFLDYISTQKAYIEALNGWLTKFLIPEVEFRRNGPLLHIICHDWLASMEKLPNKAVVFALKNFSKDVKALRDQQGLEQQQKNKVDSLAKELEKKTFGFQKSDTRFLETKLIEYRSSEHEVENSYQSNEHLMEQNDQMDWLRHKLDIEKEKHHNCVQETQRIMLNRFQTGFRSVFESFSEFSKSSTTLYSNLANCSVKDAKSGNPSFIEGSHVEEKGYE